MPPFVVIGVACGRRYQVVDVAGERSAFSFRPSRVERFSQRNDIFTVRRCRTVRFDVEQREGIARIDLAVGLRHAGDNLILFRASGRAKVHAVVVGAVSGFLANSKTHP